jgi:hypothetical protein
LSAGAVTPGSEISLTAIGVVPAVTAALSEELALLPEDARLVLEGAAVADDPFEPEPGVMYVQHRDDRRAEQHRRCRSVG